MRHGDAAVFECDLRLTETDRRFAQVVETVTDAAGEFHGIEERLQFFAECFLVKEVSLKELGNVQKSDRRLVFGEGHTVWKCLFDRVANVRQRHLAVG